MCECVMLTMIIITFLVVGTICARRIQTAINDRSTAMHEPSIGSNSQRLRRDIIVTVAVVFVTFLFRTVFSIMFAVAELLQNDGACEQLCSAECNSVYPPQPLILQQVLRIELTHFCSYTLMQLWIAFTPEFQSTIIIISSPLTLLVLSHP